MELVVIRSLVKCVFGGEKNCKNSTNQLTSWYLILSTINIRYNSAGQYHQQAAVLSRDFCGSLVRWCYPARHNEVWHAEILVYAGVVSDCQICPMLGCVCQLSLQTEIRCRQKQVLETILSSLPTSSHRPVMKQGVVARLE